jgi:hypothetical protein
VEEERPEPMSRQEMWDRLWDAFYDHGLAAFNEPESERDLRISPLVVTLHALMQEAVRRSGGHLGNSATYIFPAATRERGREPQ